MSEDTKSPLPFIKESALRYGIPETKAPLPETAARCGESQPGSKTENGIPGAAVLLPDEIVARLLWSIDGAIGHQLRAHIDAQAAEIEELKSDNATLYKVQQDMCADIREKQAEIERLREALENIAVYGCGMLSQPAAANMPEESWLRARLQEYERVAYAALNPPAAPVADDADDAAEALEAALCNTDGIYTGNDFLSEIAERMRDYLAAQGYTLRRETKAPDGVASQPEAQSAPAMTEFELKLEAERLAYGAMVDADRMQGIINLAKKFRG